MGNNALNGLYFYPKPVQERAFAIGLTDRNIVARKRKWFMISFFLVMLAALVLIIGLSYAVVKKNPKAKYGDMQSFIKKLEDMGYRKVELIDTTNGKFMKKSEAGWMGLSGSAILTGTK